MTNDDLYKNIIRDCPEIETGLLYLTEPGERQLYKMLVCQAYRQGQIDQLNEAICRMETGVVH